MSRLFCLWSILLFSPFPSALPPEHHPDALVCDKNSYAVRKAAISHILTSIPRSPPEAEEDWRTVAGHKSGKTKVCFIWNGSRDVTGSLQMKDAEVAVSNKRIQHREVLLLTCYIHSEECWGPFCRGNLHPEDFFLRELQQVVLNLNPSLHLERRTLIELLILD